MMTAYEKSILANLVRSKDYPVLRKLADELFLQWSKDRPTGETEFAYLKSSLSRDYQKEGIILFFQEIERATLDNKNSV